MAHSDFSRVFVDRPILAAVLSILIFVAGLIAMPNLPISEYPEVVPPSVAVTAIYPGASAPVRRPSTTLWAGSRTMARSKSKTRMVTPSR